MMDDKELIEALKANGMHNGVWAVDLLRDAAARLTALAEENERLKAERNKGEWTKEVPDECGRWYWMRGTESDNRWPMRLLTDIHGDPVCFGGTDGEIETLDILEDGLVEIWSEPIAEPALSEVPR